MSPQIQKHFLPNDGPQRLVDSLAHAYKAISFYRQLFDHHGVRPNSDPLRALDLLPTLDDPAYIRLQASVLSRLQRTPFVTDYTSGTTGPRRIRVATASDEDAEALICRRFFESIGITPRDRVVGVDIDSSPIYLFYGRVAREIGVRWSSFISVLPNGREGLGTLERVAPTVLITVPSVLGSLLSPDPEGFCTRLRHLSKIVSIGEEMPRRLRDFLLKTLGCEVFSFYGSTEIGSVAGECREHRGMHIQTDSVIPTLLTSTEHLGSYEGSVLWTTTHFRDQPLIKFDTKDFVSVDVTPCRCGDKTPRITRVRRLQEQITLFGYKIPYELFLRAVEDVLSPGEYLQISVERDRGPIRLVFHLPIRLEARRSWALDILSSVDDIPYFVRRGFVQCSVSFHHAALKEGRKLRKVFEGGSYGYENRLLLGGRGVGGRRSSSAWSTLRDD